jgi:hypothetical protein
MWQVVKSGKELVDRAAARAEANIDSCSVEPLPFRFRDESTYERVRVQCENEIAQRLSVRLTAVMEPCRAAVWSSSNTPSHLLKNGHNTGPERELITSIAVVRVAARTLLSAVMMGCVSSSIDEEVCCPQARSTISMS